MDVWLQFVSTMALVGGVVFAGVEWRTARLERRKQQQIELLRSFDTAMFARSMRRVLDLADDTSKERIDTDPELADDVFYWLGAMESLGQLVHDRAVDLRTVERTIAGPIQVSWRKLHRYVDDDRRVYHAEAMFEWCQWLVDQIARLERDEGRVPAHIGEAAWRP